MSYERDPVPLCFQGFVRLRGVEAHGSSSERHGHSVFILAGNYKLASCEDTHCHDHGVWEYILICVGQGSGTRIDLQAGVSEWIVVE